MIGGSTDPNPFNLSFVHPLQACFFTDRINNPNLVGRGKIPRWIRKQQKRPSSLKAAVACLPPQIPQPVVAVIDSRSGFHVLMFESIEVAVHMEAAFWLEWQFCKRDSSGIRHWHQFSVPEMLDELANRNGSNVESEILDC